MLEQNSNTAYAEACSQSAQADVGAESRKSPQEFVRDMLRNPDNAELAAAIPPEAVEPVTDALIAYCEICMQDPTPPVELLRVDRELQTLAIQYGMNTAFMDRLSSQIWSAYGKVN